YNGSRFDGWERYTMNSVGQLTIEFSPAQNEYELFVAIGAQSGEVRLLHDDPYGGTADWVREKSIQTKSTKQLVCNGLSSRLAVGNRARIAFTDGTEIRIRVKPG